MNLTTKQMKVIKEIEKAKKIIQEYKWALEREEEWLHRLQMKNADIIREIKELLGGAK